MSVDADKVIESKKEQTEELTLWFDDHLENITIYDFSKQKHLLSDDEASAGLNAILHTLKSGLDVSSLGQYWVTLCLYASRDRQELDKFLYIFDEASYPKANFVDAPAVDFKSLVSSTDYNSKESDELSKFHNKLVAKLTQNCREGMLAAYVGFVAGVLLRCAVKRPKTVLNHIHSKMNDNFRALYPCSCLSLPILPVTERDLALIQAQIAPPCLWTKTIVFYSIGSRAHYSSMEYSLEVRENFHVFDAMLTRHFKYFRLNIIYLYLALWNYYQSDFNLLRKTLANNPNVKSGMEKIGVFFEASYSINETRFVIVPFKSGNKSIYWPYCRVFDEKYFSELDSKNHRFLKMTFIKLLPYMDKDYDWPSDVDYEEVKSLTDGVEQLLHEEAMKEMARIKLMFKSISGSTEEQ